MSDSGSIPKLHSLRSRTESGANALLIFFSSGTSTDPPAPHSLSFIECPVMSFIKMSVLLNPLYLRLIYLFVIIGNKMPIHSLPPLLLLSVGRFASHIPLRKDKNILQGRFYFLLLVCLSEWKSEINNMEYSGIRIKSVFTLLCFT